MNPRNVICVCALCALCVLSGLLFAPTAPRAQSTAAPAQQQASSVRFANGGSAAQIPAQFIGSRIFLPVHVNRRGPCLFELDSTAAVSSIDSGRAAELSIADLRAPVVSLAGVDVSLAALAPVTDNDFAARVGRAYEGTLGNDFFASVVAELDYDRRAVRLFDSASYQYSGSGTNFPLDSASGIPVVHAKFSIGGKTLDADFAVNTALDAPVLFFKRYADAHSLFSSHIATIPASDAPTADGSSAVIARLRNFQIGSFVVQSPLVELSRTGSLPSSEERFAGEIGAGMLRRFTVVFDGPHHRIILSPNRDFRDPDYEDMSGLTVIAAGNNLRRFEVVQVWRDSPGANAGIQKGDVIAGVDEEPAADLTLADLRELFRQLDHSHRVLIERHGKTQVVTIQLRRLL
jgi:PDZ domain